MNKTNMKTAGRAPVKIIVGVTLVAILIALSFILPVQQYTLSALDWIESLGIYGYGIFIVAYIVFTVLFLPGFILTVGGGALFGIFGGFIAVSLGSTMGACLAFLLGRFVARDAIDKKVAGNEKFAAIDRAVGQQGWKIVFLTRLSPIFPFNLINYAYGLTGVPFWHYALASWIGMMPGTLVYVYLGWAAGDAAKAALGESTATSGMEWTLRIVGLLVAIAVTVYITRLARRALREAVPEATKSNDPSD